MEQALDQTETKCRHLEHYDLLAELFHYPDDNYSKKVKSVLKFLKKNYPDAAEELNDFAEFAAQSTAMELQELFLRSFDVQAITTLDIGYVLFGDDYKRGQLLVHLNREHREAGNTITTELSDHLPNVIRLIPKLKNQELLDELVKKIIGAAVKKMIGEFDPEKIKKKDEVYKKHLKTIIDVSLKYRTIYCSTLKVLFTVLKKDFDLSDETVKNSDFFQKLGEEMRIEA